MFEACSMSILLQIGVKVLLKKQEESARERALCQLTECF